MIFLFLNRDILWRFKSCSRFFHGMTTVEMDGIRNDDWTSICSGLGGDFVLFLPFGVDDFAGVLDCLSFVGEEFGDRETKVEEEEEGEISSNWCVELVDEKHWEEAKLKESFERR